jgi:protein-tyrosine phosphatase
MPEILDLRQAPTPDETARQIATALAGGALVALPSEAGYLLAADPAQLARPDRPGGVPEPLAVTRVDGYFDPTPFLTRIDATPAERAIASRLWPGPVGWICDELPFPVWIPAQLSIASVLAAHQGPLAFFEVSGDGPFDPGILGDAVSLIVTDGPPRSGPLTLIRPNNSRCPVIREGVLTEHDIRRALARKIVFVCTGNTCRSPMAEGIFKWRLAQRLGCGIDELPDRGFVVFSAGIAAMANDPATSESIDAMRDLGIDLTSHRSRPAMAEEIGRADDVIAMTRSHLITLVSRYPVLGGTLRLLGGPDGDLDDPIGGSADVYRACAATIRHHVDRLLLEMGLS